jgi:hypothetical protein
MYIYLADLCLKSLKRLLCYLLLGYIPTNLYYNYEYNINSCGTNLHSWCILTCVKLIFLTSNHTMTQLMHFLTSMQIIQYIIFLVTIHQLNIPRFHGYPSRVVKTTIYMTSKTLRSLHRIGWLSLFSFWRIREAPSSNLRRDVRLFTLKFSVIFFPRECYHRHQYCKHPFQFIIL